MNTKDFVKQKLLKLLDDPKQFGSYTENDNITHLESRYYGNYKFIICCNKYYQDRNTSRIIKLLVYMEHLIDSCFCLQNTHYFSKIQIMENFLLKLKLEHSPLIRRIISYTKR